MHTHRVARLVAILLFLAALVYFCGGMAVGLPLWSRGLGEGWGSGFSGWLAIPILAGTVFGAIVLLVFGAILYFLARIDTNLATARQQPSVSTVEPPESATVAGAVMVAGEASPIVPPETAPVPVEPIVVGAAATLAAASDESPQAATEIEAVAPPEPAQAGLGAVATTAVAGVVAAGIAAVAGDEDETAPAATEAGTDVASEAAEAGAGEVSSIAAGVVAGVAAVAAHEGEAAPAESVVAPEMEAETSASPAPAEAEGGAVAPAAVMGAVVAGAAAAAVHEDEATPAEIEAASENAVPTVPQVEIGPLEAPEPEGEASSSELGVPASATAVTAAIADTQTARDAEIETPVIAATTEQTLPPFVESSEAVAESPVVAPAVAAPKTEADAPKLSGLDALLIGLGRLAVGQKPDKPAETPPPASGKAEAKVAPVATPAPDLQAELPAVEDAAPQEFTGKLPGADEAARIASEMSGGDSGKPTATE